MLAGLVWGTMVPRVYLSPCGRGYEGRVNDSEPLAGVGEGVQSRPQFAHTFSSLLNGLLPFFPALRNHARITSSRHGYNAWRCIEAGPVLVVRGKDVNPRIMARAENGPPLG